eukprot:CAMPEP_0172476040 /NCGR_PEP_ID=MMETSP1065-20121228/70175_1 /TAXON_ID=265537 /ORGANISM="Amphiprora paludosa, Strain CCMP125" /LENGTH=313 /DNA_ID=CAMNT_0013234255 /DNA_START=71 /DNA_END=1012 /DNA_ORIENTATION=+
MAKGHCLSFTAPTISEDEVQKERESLTESERDEIQGDVWGTAAIVNESASFQSQALHEFDRVLELQNETSLHAYREAMSMAPDLVRQETSPLKFLRASGFDVENAVGRMLKYWEHRVELFGRDRAFLPLESELPIPAAEDNGTTAMSPQDWEFWNQKTIYILPQPDAHGRTIIFGDRSKWTGANRQSSLRCLFLTFHLASMSSMVQKYGVVIVMDTQKVTTADYCRKISRHIVRMCGESAPIRLRAWHACYADVKSQAMLLNSSILFMLGRNLRLRVLQHYGSPAELAWDLGQYGMAKAILPKQVGGENHDKF